MAAVIDLTGKTFGLLTAIKRAGSAENERQEHATWRCRCECGAAPIVRSDNLRSGNTRSCGCNNPLAWKGDKVGNQGAHDRVTRLRGPARDHACVDCGHQAAHWSLTMGPPGTWSTNVDDYDPRCVSCHRLFDNAWKIEMAA